MFVAALPMLVLLHAAPAAVTPHWAVPDDAQPVHLTFAAAAQSGHLLEDAAPVGVTRLLNGALRLGLAPEADLALDDGGGAGSSSSGPIMDPDTARLAGGIVALVVGFGLGHLIIGEMPGFWTFLIVDAALLVLEIVFAAIIPAIIISSGSIDAFAWVFLAWIPPIGFVISHIVQAYQVFTWNPGPGNGARSALTGSLSPAVAASQSLTGDQRLSSFAADTHAAIVPAMRLAF